MKKLVLLVIIGMMLTAISCSNANELKIENVDIINSSYYDTSEGIPILLIPHPVAIVEEKGKYQPIDLGTVKNGKMTLIFPKHLDNDFLFDSTDFDDISTKTKGLKFMFFSVNQFINLVHNETFKTAVDLQFIIYSNKKGKMNVEGKEIILKKGWNVFNITEKDEITNYERINLNDFSKELYTWHLF